MRDADLLVVVYPSPGGWDEVRAEFGDVLPSAFANLGEGLPGPAFLPMPRRRDGSRVWYGLAAPDSDAEELVEVTRAAVEPGLGFVTPPADVVDPGGIATAIAEYTKGRWVLIDVPSDVDEAVAVRALDRQAANLRRRRGLVRPTAPRGAGRIKADLDLAVSTNDLSGIDRLLAELNEVPHVTADNRCYVAVDALSRAGRHADALSVEGLGRLMEATPPVAVRRGVLRAFHGALFSSHPTRSVDKLSDELRALLASVCERRPGDLTDADAEVLIAAVESGLIDPPADVDSLRARAEAEELRRATARHSVPVANEPGDTDEHSAVGTFEERLAQAMIQNDEGMLASLAQEVASGTVYASAPMHAFLAGYLPVDDDGRPSTDEPQVAIIGSWQAWLNRASSNGVWDRAGTVAKQSASESWAVPEDVLRQFSGLTSQVNEEQAANLRQGLGLLLSSELELGSPAVRDALLAAIELVALWPPQTDQERDAVLGWVDQLSRAGLTEAQVTNLVDNIEVLVDGALTVWTLPWAAELLLTATFDPNSARHDSAQRLYLRLESQALKTRVDPMLRETLQDVASAIGMETNKSITCRNDAEDLLVHLDGRTIGIYTLMESAGRAAATTIRRYAPNATVTLNHDKTSTERLRALAANVEVMVVVTAAAQHAATGAVEKCRPTARGPALKVGTKGRAGILAALRDWSARA